MKVLSFQPDSLYRNGGCGRVLRRLYNGHESDISSMYVSYDGTEYNGAIQETQVQAWPLRKDWMRWKVRDFFAFLRERFFFKQTAQKLLKKASGIDFDVLHIINHGPFCAVLVTAETIKNKVIWASFHDHFSVVSSYANCELLWNKAHRRMVISKELGTEYQKLFGNLEYEIITDGVAAKEISDPGSSLEKSQTINIYFGGLLHIEYLPLFRVLADALDELAKKDGIKFLLVLRGTQAVDFLENRSFALDYRKEFVTDEQIRKELEEADILYLPMKFSIPDFYLYSLSTKMVGYLGVPGTILYHGPHDSAVYNLLKEYNASIGCTSLKVNDMVDALKAITNDESSIHSSNAKKLAKEKFLMLDLRNQFWQFSDLKQISA